MTSSKRQGVPERVKSLPHRRAENVDGRKTWPSQGGLGSGANYGEALGARSSFLHGVLCTETRRPPPCCLFPEKENASTP